MLPKMLPKKVEILIVKNLHHSLIQSMDLHYSLVQSMNVSFIYKKSNTRISDEVYKSKKKCVYALLVLKCLTFFPIEIIYYIINFLHEPIKIDCRDDMTILYDDNVIVWGNNPNELFGEYRIIQNLTNSKLPQSQIIESINNKKIKMMVSSSLVSLFLTNETSVIYETTKWRKLIVGQVMVPNIVSIHFKKYIAVALSKNANCYKWSYSDEAMRLESPFKIFGDKSPILFADVGNSHLFVVDKERTLHIKNYGAGALGIYNLSLPNVVIATSGPDNILALTSDENVHICDFGLEIKIMEEKFDSKIISMASGRDFFMFLTINGDLYIRPCNKYVYNSPKIHLSKIKSIHCGNNHSIIVLRNENIYVWGRNTDGELGLGDLIDQLTPKKIDY